MYQKPNVYLLMLLAFFTASTLRAEEKTTEDSDLSQWSISDAYLYCQSNYDEMASAERKRFAQYFIDCQDPKTGNFVDKLGKAYYSVKVYHMLKQLDAEPRYPLSVCQGINESWGQVDGKLVTEQISPEMFRKWLDKVYQTENAYAAGSSISHFITPHVMNLKNAGKTAEDSPFIPVFRQWIEEHQGENGFFNRPDDTDFNGWNGLMKLDTAIGAAGIIIPHQERMLKTVLKYQNAEDGNFTAAGGCTNHNALHTLRQWSKRNDMLMWPEIYLAMERFTRSVELRYDTASGFFRVIPGFNGEPDHRATELVRMAIGNVIDYCRILLDPDKVDRFDKQQISEGEGRITPERVRNLLIRATGISTLASDKVKAQTRANVENKYGS